MRRRRLALFPLAVWLAFGHAAASPGGPPRKKVIEYGWDVPSPEFVRGNVRTMERWPFDGIVIRLAGGAEVFVRKPRPANAYSADLAHLRATKFSRFGHNFALTLTATEAGWDWLSESDWKASDASVRLLARAVQIGGLAGIAFDPEPYGVSPWDYQAQRRARDLSFAQYSLAVRHRGARFMRVLQEECPQVRVLMFFQLSWFGALLDWPSGVRDSMLARHHWGLLPAFVNGMLDAALDGATIIDGNELAYYYVGEAAYTRAQDLIRRRALPLVAAENRRAYALRVRVGSAVYLDQVLGLRQPTRDYPSGHLTPQQQLRWLEHNVYHALRTADEYVWCYGERVHWWKRQVPAGADAAIREARRKHEAGAPLGFAIEEMVKEADRNVRK